MRLRRAAVAISAATALTGLRNFVAAVPREMEEAAAIDGAGPARIFWRILFLLVQRRMARGPVAGAVKG